MNGHSVIGKWPGAAPSNAPAPGAMVGMAALEQHGKSLYAMATNGRSGIGKWPGAGLSNAPAPGAMALTAALEQHGKCLGATAANGRTQVGWEVPWGNGRNRPRLSRMESALARQQQMAACK